MIRLIMLYNDEDIERLITDLESDCVERKESWSGDAPKKGREAVCAFANDLPEHRKPGILVIGVDNNGNYVKTMITDKLLLTLSDIRTDGNILPPPTIFVEKRFFKGNEIAIVTVQPSDSPPVRYKGKIWIRIGPRGAIATVQDERILNEKRRYRDIPFDIQPVNSATINELSESYFENEYLQNAFSPDMLEANDRSYEQRLAACKMIDSIDSAIPTILSLLVIGIRPHDWIPCAYIQFLRIDGITLTDEIIDEAKYSGQIAQILRQIEEKLDSHNRVSVDVTSQPTELRKIQYPKIALEQIIRNAVMHRTYESTNAPIRVYWFNDRIEIFSPGGPFGTVTKENFGQPGITDYRNPNLADALKTLGYVQRFGIGISLANKELIKNGNPMIEFEVNESSIVAIIRRQ